MGYITEITAKSFVPARNNACKLVGQAIPLEPARAVTVVVLAAVGKKLEH